MTNIKRYTVRLTVALDDGAVRELTTLTGGMSLRGAQIWADILLKEAADGVYGPPERSYGVTVVEEGAEQ